MYGIFDTLGAIAKNPNNNSRMLFFGIPKGTFYKKSPLAGFGAEPHKGPGSCMQPSGPVLRVQATYNTPLHGLPSFPQAPAGQDRL